MIFEGVGAGIWIPSKTALCWSMTKPILREKVSGYLLTSSIGVYAPSEIFNEDLIV